MAECQREKRYSLDAIRVSYILLCDAHSVGAGKHTFHGVFDRIFAPEFPTFHSSCVLAMELLGPPGEECQVVIRYQDSSEVNHLPEIRTKGLKFGPFGNAQVTVNLQGLPVPKEGFFSFRVFKDDRLIGERVLYAEQIRR